MEMIKIKVPRNIFIDTDELEVWMEDNNIIIWGDSIRDSIRCKRSRIESHYDFSNSGKNDVSTVEFEKEEDAVAFKLRWL